jgi:hypothetical protein
MMLAELAVGDVLLAPIVVYAIVAAVIFALLRLLLGRIGLRRLAWHPALFELALYVAILSLLVRYF